MYKLFFLSILLILSGCSPKSPGKSWTARVRLLPVIIQNESKESTWTIEDIREQIRNANVKWKPSKISFVMMPPVERIENDLFIQKGMTGFFKSMVTAGDIAKSTHAYPVFFVSKIIWDDKPAFGISTAPSVPSLQYGTSIAAMAKQRKLVLAHELGHAWNLKHVWSDNLEDTPSEGADDCNENNRCNLMSYCLNQNCGPNDETMTPLQIEEVRKWSLSSSRRHLIIENVPQSIMVLPFSAGFEPEVDLVDDWHY